MWNRVRDAVLLEASYPPKREEGAEQAPTLLPPATVFSRKLLALAEAPFVVDDDPGFFFVDRGRD